MPWTPGNPTRNRVVMPAGGPIDVLLKPGSFEIDIPDSADDEDHDPDIGDGDDPFFTGPGHRGSPGGGGGGGVWTAPEDPDEPDDPSTRPPVPGAGDIAYQCAGMRVGGGCHKIRLRQTSGVNKWAFERAWVEMIVTGRRRC